MQVQLRKVVMLLTFPTSRPVSPSYVSPFPQIFFGTLCLLAGIGDTTHYCNAGGGASLELLEGKALPGLVALTDK